MDRRASYDSPAFVTAKGSVHVVARSELCACEAWQKAFSNQRKDHRYYELVEDTICPDFAYRYFVIRDGNGSVQAIQPFFVLDQDLLGGLSARIRPAIDALRRAWPRFMYLRTLMVGCAAGEGHLDDGTDRTSDGHVELLAGAIVHHARHQKAQLIVLKEFPAEYRSRLACFLPHGFTRVPSLPMTQLNIEYASFDEYMKKALNSATRTKLRKKFRATEQAPPIELNIVDDVTPFVDEVYPLYLQVYERSKMHFEKLTKAYLCRMGDLIPDKVRFFIWRQEGKIVAFTLCMLQDESMYAEYIGLDYTVALKLHLYHYTVRDMITWAIAHDYKLFRSSGLNYDPKLHLRHRLDPVDLYVRHTSTVANAVLKQLLPLLEPTRYDKTLQKFPNYNELWASP